MLSSEEACVDHLNNDVLRKIYVYYVKLLNEKKLEEISSTMASVITKFVISSLSTYNTHGFCHHGARPYETIVGVVRPYGMGRVITMDFGSKRCVLRLKCMADSYLMTDWEYNCLRNDFVDRVLHKTVRKFNSVPVMVDTRKPKNSSRRWVRMETRDKFIEELVVHTSIPQARVSQLVDG